MGGGRKKRAYLHVLFEMNFDDVLGILTCCERHDWAKDCQHTLKFLWIWSDRSECADSD